MPCIESLVIDHIYHLDALSINMKTALDCWDLSSVSTPRRSSIPHLKPVGLGTPLVESLTSYLSRLADILHVAMSAMINRGLFPILIDNLETELTGAGRFNPATISSLNSGRHSKMSFIGNALELATGQNDIENLTIKKWSFFNQYVIRVKKFKSWCPNCYSEWKERGEVIYEPLLWMIKDIDVCGIHKKYLESVCPDCSREVMFINSAVYPGTCSHCGGWLGKSTGQQKPRTDRSKNMARSILKYECAGRFIASLKPTINSEEVDLTKSFVEYAKKQIDNDASEYGSGKEQSCSADPTWYYGLERPDLMMLNTIWATLSGRK